MTVPSSTELALDTLEPGRRHDLLLHLADDGLGFPVHVPVIVARGSKPGPVFGIVAALHGNELNGIWVIHSLMAKLEPARVRGTVVAVVVANPPFSLKDWGADIWATDPHRRAIGGVPPPGKARQMG